MNRPQKKELREEVDVLGITAVHQAFSCFRPRTWKAPSHCAAAEEACCLVRCQWRWLCRLRRSDAAYIYQNQPCSKNSSWCASKNKANKTASKGVVMPKAALRV